jgi:hypothetical protein
MAQQQANWAAQFQREGQETGLGGLASLYGGAGPGELNTNKNFDLTNRGQESLKVYLLELTSKQEINLGLIMRLQSQELLQVA